MVKYIVELRYDDYEFFTAGSAAQFLETAVIHAKDESAIPTFRIKAVKVEQEGGENDESNINKSGKIS